MCIAKVPEQTFSNATAGYAGYATRKPIYTLRADYFPLLQELNHTFLNPIMYSPFCATCHEGCDIASGFPDLVIIHSSKIYRSREERLRTPLSPNSEIPIGVGPSSHSPTHYPLLVEDTHWPKHWLGEPTIIIHRFIAG
jgi:hypothetical protein